MLASVLPSSRPQLFGLRHVQPGHRLLAALWELIVIKLGTFFFSIGQCSARVWEEKQADGQMREFGRKGEKTEQSLKLQVKHQTNNRCKF